jgi:hypothetical protein
MGRLIRLFEAPVSVSKWDLCAALAIVVAFVIVLAVFLSAFRPHRTHLSVRPDFGLPVISELSR